MSVKPAQRSHEHHEGSAEGLFADPELIERADGANDHQPLERPAEARHCRGMRPALVLDDEHPRRGAIAQGAEGREQRDGENRRAVHGSEEFMHGGAAKPAAEGKIEQSQTTGDALDVARRRGGKRAKCIEHGSRGADSRPLKDPINGWRALGAAEESRQARAAVADSVRAVRTIGRGGAGHMIGVETNAGGYGLHACLILIP